MPAPVGTGAWRTHHQRVTVLNLTTPLLCRLRRDHDQDADFGNLLRRPQGIAVIAADLPAGQSRDHGHANPANRQRADPRRRTEQGDRDRPAEPDSRPNNAGTGPARRRRKPSSIRFPERKFRRRRSAYRTGTSAFGGRADINFLRLNDRV